MAIHMSIRLAWHSDGWNGHICKRPCENSYCIGQHSYPGDLIASTRDLEFEAAHAGESCSALPCKAACGLSVNAFGKDTITVRVDPPSFWKKNDADAINITLPPSTVCTWCYEAMYNDEVEARGATAQKYDYAKRKEGAENYFAQFEPGKSLIFYYAGYSNPFSENEEDNYVIVGVSRVSKIGDTFYYDNTSDEVKRKYAGGFVWQKPVTSTYPDEGFCIPYWKYMDDEEILNRIVIKPQNRGPFKYGSREVYNDDAIEVVNQLIAVVDTLIEIGDDTEDWNKRKAWLNSVLNELWTARGPYPGFPSILESLGLHTFVSSYIGLTFDDEMKEYRIAVREFLEGNRDDVQGMTLSKSDMKKIRREYQLLDDDTADFMFEILSRFDLRADQVCSIVSEDRENVSITASIAEMKENPYIIFEQYIGYDSDDVIPFYRIDNGVIPSPEYGIDEILDCGSTERLRAFCVDELNRIAAHSFGKAKSILKTINARVERLPEWKRYVYRMKNFDIDQEIWEGALVQKKDDQGILYLYLKENYEDERTIEDALRNLADRPDITLKMAITPEKFKRGLRVEGSPLEKKTAAEYDLILEHQAEICMQIFVKPLCVLSGAAGTGKTTVSHLLSMELLYTAITRAQKKVTIFLQQDISTLTTLSRAEKSAVRKINSSVFKFEPLPDDLLYAGSNWYESGKKIATLSQYFVRSKSEAIITNLLVDRNIPFKYEEPLYAPDGTMYLPDFTVKFRGEEYYWEHVGRINDTNYMAHWAKKEAWYKKHFPGKLLVTYESNELTTDAAAIIARNM